MCLKFEFFFGEGGVVRMARKNILTFFYREYPNPNTNPSPKSNPTPTHPPTPPQPAHQPHPQPHPQPQPHPPNPPQPNKNAKKNFFLPYVLTTPNFFYKENVDYYLRKATIIAKVQDIHKSYTLPFSM